MIGDRMGMDAGHQDFQDYIVANLYPGAIYHIGEHTDNHAMWGDTKGENVILSYAVHGGGVFCCRPVRPVAECPRANLSDQLYYYGVTKSKFTAHVLENKLGTVVYQPPNSLLVMGGFFQSQLQHGTLSHNQARPPSLETRTRCVKLEICHSAKAEIQLPLLSGSSLNVLL